MVSVTTRCAPAADVVAIPAYLIDALCGRLQKVQMLPLTAQQALELARDPECTIREFARFIEQDIKLATEMLRLANSPIYCGNSPVASLSEAALRLGLFQCKNLILTSSFASLIEEFSIEETWVRDELWRHGMVTAVIAANLNRTLGARFQGEEFTAGLMHDIGRILLAVALPATFLAGDPVSFDETPLLLAAEQAHFHTTHCEVGTWFAIANRLPECLIEAIRYHHQPELAPSHPRLVALVAAADHIANYVQRNESAEGYQPQTNTAIRLLEAAGVPHANTRFQERAEEVLENSYRDALELCGA